MRDRPGSSSFAPLSGQRVFDHQDAPASRGATGAALATLLSYGFAMIAAACYPPMLAHGRGFLGSLIKPVLVGILSLAASFKLFAGHPLAVAFSFLALYACLLAVAGVFRREDWQLARRILSRSPQEEES